MRFFLCLLIVLFVVNHAYGEKEKEKQQQQQNDVISEETLAELRVAFAALGSMDDEDDSVKQWLALGGYGMHEEDSKAGTDVSVHKLFQRKAQIKTDGDEFLDGGSIGANERRSVDLLALADEVNVGRKMRNQVPLTFTQLGDVVYTRAASKTQIAQMEELAKKAVLSKEEFEQWKRERDEAVLRQKQERIEAKQRAAEIDVLKQRHQNAAKRLQRTRDSIVKSKARVAHIEKQLNDSK